MIYDFRLTISSRSAWLRAGCGNLCLFVAKFLTGLQDRQALNIEYRTSNAEYRRHLVGQAKRIYDL
jgi:hypothetical protein